MIPLQMIADIRRQSKHEKIFTSKKIINEPEVSEAHVMKKKNETFEVVIYSYALSWYHHYYCIPQKNRHNEMHV